MFHDVKISSKIGCYVEATHLLDYLEQCFISSGWTIDKKELGNSYDLGEGTFFGGGPRPTFTLDSLGSYRFYGTVRGSGDGTLYSAATRYATPNPYLTLGRVKAARLGDSKIYQKISYISTSHSAAFTLSTSPVVSINTLPPGSTVGGYVTIDSAAFVETTLPNAPSGDPYLSITTSSLNSQEAYGYMQIYLKNPYLLSSTFPISLYVHTTAPNGESIYHSFNIDPLKRLLYMYTNTGFSSELPVDSQPGNIRSVDNLVADYFYILLPPYAYYNKAHDLFFVGDSASFFFCVYGQYFTANSIKKAAYFYSGVTDKFFNFSGGQVVTGSSAKISKHYVRYEGTWYGETILVGVQNKQGFIDLVTPSNYTTAGYNHYSGEIFVTQQVAGVNLGLTDNFEYKPIGTVHNFYKHYGVTPALPMELKINGDTYWSIPLDANNRKAVKAVEV